MFLTNIYSSQPASLSDRLSQTLQVETHRVSLEERGVRLALTLVDTPGRVQKISLQEMGCKSESGWPSLLRTTEVGSQDQPSREWVRLALTLADTPGRVHKVSLQFMGSGWPSLYWTPQVGYISSAFRRGEGSSCPSP